MIKLTDYYTGKPMWVNPLKIETLGKVENSEGSKVYLESHNRRNYLQFKETPEEIIFLIKSKGLSETDLEIINDLRKEYSYGTIHEVSETKLNQAINHISFLLAKLDKP